MRYYSTQHPIGPGTFPKPEGNRVLEIVNFDEKIFHAEPARECWGYIDYEKPLSENMIARLVSIFLVLCMRPSSLRNALRKRR